MVWGYSVPKHLFFELITCFLALMIILIGKVRIGFNSIDYVAFVLLLLPVVHTIVFDNYQYSRTYLDTNLFMLIYYLGLRSLSGIDEIRKLVKWVVYVGSIISLYGIIQYAGIDPLLPFGSQPFGHRVVGTLGNANSMGSFLAIGLPLSIYYYKVDQSPKLLKIFMPILILVGLLISFSRGAIIGLTISSLMFFSPEILKIIRMRLSYPGKRILILIAGFAVMILVFIQLYNFNPDSAKGRLFIWKVTTGMIRDSPFSGIGYGRYGVEYLNYQAEFFSDPENSEYYDRAANMKQSDNEYMLIWAELGTIGLIIAIGAIVFLLQKMLIQEFKRKQRNGHTLLIKTAGIAIFAVLIHSLVDNPYRVLPIQIAFYLLMAVIAFGSDLKDQAQYQFPRRIKIGLAVIAIGALMFVARNAYQKSRACLLWRAGNIVAVHGNLSDAIVKYQHAIRLLPSNYELKFQLGAAYSYNRQPKEALPLLATAGENYNDKNLYIVRGATYLQLKQHDLAEDDFKKAISMYPKLLLPRLWLGEMYIQQNRTMEGINILKQIMEIEPKIMTDQIISIKRDALDLLKSIG